MIWIGVFGLLMLLISVLMIARPNLWIDLALKFSRLKYMHPLEILIRLLFGVTFVNYGSETDYPILIEYIGYLLLAVGAGLLLTPPSQHRRFAIWAITKVGRGFRIAGLGSLVFGGFLIYVALSTG
jgi:hypothetical protein